MSFDLAMHIEHGQKLEVTFSRQKQTGFYVLTFQQLTDGGQNIGSVNIYIPPNTQAAEVFGMLGEGVPGEIREY